MTYAALPTTDKCNLLRSEIEKTEYKKYLLMKSKPDRKHETYLRWKHLYWIYTAKVENYWRMYFELKNISRILNLMNPPLPAAFDDYLAASEQFCREINQIADEIEQTL